ncbi:MAG TPA: hypothetical protein VFA26_15495 [Gemmataceae bacterium]|nr:hypothetical protein [Gemmataceae bacterium]
MSIRSRLERLERARPARVSMWDVICGARDLEDLDEADQATLRRLLDAAGAGHDAVEERMAALLKSAVILPPAVGRRPPPAGGGDARAGGRPPDSPPGDVRDCLNGPATVSAAERRAPAGKGR